MYAVRLRAIARPWHSWRGAGCLQANGGLRPISSASLPEPPLVPVKPIVEIVQVPEILGPLPLEPPFASMGLGGYSPVGIVQSSLEWLHIGAGLPWWATVMVGTLAVRALLSPIIVMSQRNNATLQNNMPTMTRIQREISEAKQRGDRIQCARLSNDLNVFMKEKGIKPIMNSLTPLIQFPFFISFFLGLRAMANYPVESLSHGGIFWFTDLTVPDQFYLLPIMTSLTMWATIETGMDPTKLASQNMILIKYVFRAIPLVMLPFTVHFPGAILLYWVSTNMVSLTQVNLLKLRKVRDVLKIPHLVKHKEEAVQIKGFVANAKDTWSNMKTTKQVENQQKNDEMEFNKAGKGPLVKTYRYDPTKMVSAKGSNR